MADQINITSEDDYSDCVKKFNYEIVRPDIDDMDITANYDYPTGRYDYPVINEGNLHLRKDHHFYLNFFGGPNGSLLNGSLLSSILGSSNLKFILCTPAPLPKVLLSFAGHT